MIYERRYELISYPEEDPGDIIVWNAQHVGFQARVLVNPNGSDVRHEAKLYQASAGTDTEAQDLYWQGVANRIPEWNYAIRDAEGNVADVPPPAERWESFLDLEFDLAMWLRNCIHWAHRGKVFSALLGSAGTTEMTQSTP